MLVLVLEASTSAAKALLYDSENGVAAVVNEPYSTDVDSGGRQDTEQVYLATLRAGHKVAAGRDVAAVAVSGVWHSIAVCGSGMKPAERTHTWTFTSASGLCRDIRQDKRLAAEIYKRTGCFPNVTYQPYTLRYLRENGLDLRDKLFCSQGGYNFYRMTGTLLETACMVSGMGLLNTHTKEYDDFILDFTGIKKGQLGELATYRDTLPLTAECAGALGIAPGIPVVPPHPDGALNQLGNGACRPGIMTFSVGTSAAIRLAASGPVLSDPSATWCYVGVDCHMSGAATAGACSCVNWFKDVVLEGKHSFQELESGMPDAKNAPVYLPFLFGERCPGWTDEREGSFHELRGSTTASDMFAAICEGVLFNIFQCYEILAGLCGPPDKIIVSGGILNSQKWMQMAADIFGRTLTLSKTAQASALGGAALALHAAGELEDVKDFSGGEGETVSPRNGAGYGEKYRRYLTWYEKCK